MQINGTALRVIRERSGMRVKDLAQAAGVSANHLSNIEAGRRNAGGEAALRLAQALRVELPAILVDPNANTPQAATDEPAAAGAP